MNLFDDLKSSKVRAGFSLPDFPRRPWTAEEDAILRNNAGSTEASGIVRMLWQRNLYSVKSRAVKLRIRFRGRKPERSRMMPRDDRGPLPPRNDLGLRIEDCRLALQARFNLSTADMKSDSRFRYVALPRQIAMALAWELTSKSTTLIGQHFNRDHTTVIHAIRMIAWREKHDPEFPQILCALRSELSALAESRKCVSPEGLHGLMETPTPERNAEPRTDRRIASLTQAGSCGGSPSLSGVG